MAKLGHIGNSLVNSMGDFDISRHPKQMRYQAAPRADVSTNYLKSHSNGYVKCIRNIANISAQECNKMQSCEGGCRDKTWTYFKISSPANSINQLVLSKFWSGWGWGVCVSAPVRLLTE